MGFGISSIKVRNVFILVLILINLDILESKASGYFVQLRRSYKYNIKLFFSFYACMCSMRR